MTNEQFSEYAIEIVVHAGSSRSYAMQAVNYARSFDFTTAEELLAYAQKDYHKAHLHHTELIKKDMQLLAENKPQVVNLLMIHAQDHLTMAQITLDNAKEFIKIYQKIGA